MWHLSITASLFCYVLQWSSLLASNTLQVSCSPGKPNYFLQYGQKYATVPEYCFQCATFHPILAACERNIASNVQTHSIFHVIWFTWRVYCVIKQGAPVKPVVIFLRGDIPNEMTMLVLSAVLLFFLGRRKKFTSKFHIKRSRVVEIILKPTTNHLHTESLIHKTSSQLLPPTRQ